MKISRCRLLDLIRNANNTSDTIEPAFLSYLSLLYGFMWEVEKTDGEGNQFGRPNPSKLRNVFGFKWTHTLLGSTTRYSIDFYLDKFVENSENNIFISILIISSSADSIYEAANMSMNIGLWFMKHAAMIAAKDE